MIELGANPNAKDGKGKTVLECANNLFGNRRDSINRNANRSKVINLLLEKGAKYEPILLHYYARTNNIAGIKQYFKNKVAVDVLYLGQTALIEAVYSDSYEAVEALLESEANPNIKNAEG